MSYNSKYTGQQVEDLLDKVNNIDDSPSLTEEDIANMGFTKNQGTITEVKMNGESKGASGIIDLGNVVTEEELESRDFVTIGTEQIIDGQKTFTNYVNVKRNADNDSVMHMGQNASGQGMIYLDSTTSQPLYFYNNTPNSRIQIRCLKSDGIPNIELLDGQVAMTVSTEDRYTGIFVVNKHSDTPSVCIGSDKKSSFVYTRPKLTDEIPEISSITMHGDIIFRAMQGEYNNNDYAWFRYDSNRNTLNIAAFEGGGEAMDLAVQINGKDVAKLDDLEGKVDKVDGKQLSTEDFTTALKQKLEGLNNYNDDEITTVVQSLQTQLNTLVSGDANDAINSFNEIIAFLDGIKDTQDLSSIIASIEQQIAEKYNKPSSGIPKTDLATAVQTSLNKADTALQSHQDISGKQDKLVSGTNIKTINGTSILGSGDIVIEGGGGDSSSGEDIRYFTEFTVEDFIEACEAAGDTITYDTTELFNAMKSNKVICVPYRGYDKGFIVASYKSGEYEEYPSIYLQKGDSEYYANVGDSYELIGEYPTHSSVQVVEMAGGEVVLEVLDNHIYRITDPVDYLLPFPSSIQKGTTIHFISGEFGTTIEITYQLFWANGEIPQIEPNTYYELSLMQSASYEYNAVLTKFKRVEE